MVKNTYIVEARFERGRTSRRIETWIGRGRNIRLAIRAAASEIMNRKNVKRFRHERVTFSIEKVVAKEKRPE